MSEQGTASPERDLGWLLDDLAARVDQFRQAVILSRDGLVIAASRDLSREDAEHMAALAAANALGIGYVPWVYHFADMVNSDSSPWINMLQRAIFDGDVDGAIKEAREKMKAIAAE